ncbi:unnamed protein product [Ilex paraguariensis]|uniref:GATA-type domain-containing protein n=1 Tax=Ilex paraguariensis TaxID=185542 RepID=A0ABC8QTS8_9AQUA
MTPTYLNSSSASPFLVDLNEDQHHQLFSPNPQSSSSSSLSCHMFLNSTQDQNGYYHEEIQVHQQHQPEVNNCNLHGGSSSYDQENKGDNGLKLYFWKNKDIGENQSENNPVKWMSSKMRLMKKTKNPDRACVKITTTTTQKSEDQKQLSSSLETDYSSNSSSHNSNNPIRVCADCSTTKTPLWRSGPKGPKTLCNACGIRQRKARRAMAAAAAAANGTVHGTETSQVKFKVQHRDKTKNNGHVVPYKKRFKLAAGPSHVQKKLCFEDFLINLSKSLDFHRVFPQDEKEAAILLMALSCGLVHG